MSPRARRAARVAAALLILALAAPAAPYHFPRLVGADGAFVVVSGSMSPTLDAGDVAFVRATDGVAVGDVVTFRVGGSFVTHRVVEVLDGGRAFRTQGDANDAPDAWTVREDQVVGELAFALPLWGHLPALARTPLGYVLLVLLPCAAIGALTVRDILREARRLEAAR